MRTMSRLTVVFVVAASFGIILVAGCGKREQEQPPQGPPPTARKEVSGDTQDQQAPGQPEEATDEKEEEPSSDSEEGGQEESAEKETEEKTETEEPKEVELKPDLPEPNFAGTPTNFDTTHLGPKVGEPRDDFYVPEGTELLSRGKPVTSSGQPIMGELSQVTDGEKAAKEGKAAALGPGTQWVQIDLGKPHKLYAILIWHYHRQARVYRDVIVQVSNDPEFEDATTLFNNDYDNSAGLGEGEDYEYVETFEGKLVDAGGVEARYARCYASGSTTNELNHYTEVEVYGKPAGE